MPGRNPFPRESDRVDMKIHSKYPYKIANFLNNYIYIQIQYIVHPAFSKGRSPWCELDSRSDHPGQDGMFNSIVAHGEELNVKPPENSFFRYFYRFYLGRGLVGRELFFSGLEPFDPPFSVYPVGTVGVTSCTARDVSIARPVGASGPAGSNEASCDQLYSIGCIPIYSMCA